MKEIKLFVFQLIYAFFYVLICVQYVHDPIAFLQGDLYGYDYKESILIVLLYLPIWFVEYYSFYIKTQNASFCLIRKRKYKSFWGDIQLRSILRSIVSYVFMWMLYSKFYSLNMLKMFWFNIIFALFIYELGVFLWIIFGDYIIPTVIVIVGIILSNRFAVAFSDKAIINIFCWGSYNYFINDKSGGKHNTIYIVVVETVFIILMMMAYRFKICKKSLSWRIFHE